MDKIVVDSLRNLAKGAAIISLGTFVSRLLNYAYKITVARLGAEYFGTLSLCLTLLGIVSTFAFLGLRDGVKRYISFYQGKKEEEKIRSTILSTLGLVAISSVLLGSLLFILADKLAVIFFHDQSSSVYIRFMAVILPFYTLNWIFIKCFAGFKKLKYRVYVYNIAENAFKIAITIILIFLGFKLWSAVLGYGFSIIMCFLLSAYFLEYRVFSVFRTRDGGRFVYKELLAFSIPLLFSGIMVLLLSWTDTLMLGYFTDVRKVGIYGAALLVSSLVFIGTDLLIPIYLPTITELYAQERNKEIASIFKSVNKWIFAICIPIALLLFIFPNRILSILFAPEYGIAYAAVIILVWGRLISALSFTSGHMLNMIKKTRIIFVVSAIATFCNVILNYMLIPRFGINGAAAGTCISLFVQAALLVCFCNRYLSLVFLNKDFLKVAVAGLVPAIVIYFIQRNFAVSTAAFFGLAGTFGVAYLAMLYVIKAHDDNDIAVLKAALNKKRAG
ncbi:MAG: flippase [Candidatus Omnitrophica bacterium]|nr:flippase [Candidatus Omnitrophota bacterium]